MSEKENKVGLSIYSEEPYISKHARCTVSGLLNKSQLCKYFKQGDGEGRCAFYDFEKLECTNVKAISARLGEIEETTANWRAKTESVVDNLKYGGNDER